MKFKAFFNKLYKISILKYIFNNQYKVSINLYDDFNNINSQITYDSLQNVINENSKLRLQFDFNLADYNNFDINETDSKLENIFKNIIIQLLHKNKLYDYCIEMALVENHYIYIITFELNKFIMPKKKLTPGKQIINILYNIQQNNTMTNEALYCLTNVSKCRLYMGLSYPLLFRVNFNLSFSEQASFNNKIRYQKTPITFLNKNYYITNYIFISNITKIINYLRVLQLI